MKEFTSTAEMQAHYREVMARRPPFEGSKRKAEPPAPEPEPALVEPVPPPAVPLFLPEHPVKRLGKVVARYYGVEWRHLKDAKRATEFVKPRHVFFYLAYEMLNTSFPIIGRVVERDHSSVVHGYRKIRDGIVENDDLRAEVDAIRMQWRELNAHQD